MNFEIDTDRIKADAAESFKKEVERKIIEQATEKRHSKSEETVLTLFSKCL